jgi:hypothetical protein
MADGGAFEIIRAKRAPAATYSSRSCHASLRCMNAWAWRQVANGVPHFATQLRRNEHYRTRCSDDTIRVAGRRSMEKKLEHKESARGPRSAGDKCRSRVAVSFSDQRRAPSRSGGHSPCCAGLVLAALKGLGCMAGLILAFSFVCARLRLSVRAARQGAGIDGGHGFTTLSILACVELSGDIRTHRIFSQ